MNKRLYEICLEVRNKQLATYFDVAGACKEVSLAICLSAVKEKINLCFCSGTYDEEVHYWIRHDGIIYDATASQFGSPEKVLVTPEKHPYEEKNFVIFNSHLINKLMD